ncbi:MAG: PHP domain-containing protein, partial [Phycisphaerae bacterium]|nr:PHP domain-containing protein [Phycisphaerae bacterium]
MKTELHLHTTRYSGCALNGPHELLGRCADCGYEAVYITEHDAVWADREIDELQSQSPRIRIFSGVELTVGLRPLLHLLVLGTNDPAYLKFGRDPTAVIEKARHEGHLTILAHPCRWEDAQAVLDPEGLP